MAGAMPRLTWQAQTLALRTPFRLAYGVSQTRQSFWLRLAEDAGWGEAAIPPYYGISDESMIAFWQKMAQDTRPFPEDPAQISAWVGADGPSPARCGLDMALHDRLGRQRGQPLWQLLDLPRPQPLPTSFTIGIDTPEEMARLAEEARAFPVLKIKLGSDDDLTRLQAVRAARPHARLLVDATAGWTPQEAVAHIRAFAPLDLALVEQPVAKDDIAGMGYVQAHTDLPVVADESLRTAADLEALAEVGVKGVCLKFQKLGGIGPTLGLLRRARQLGMGVMLGCMVETSLSVTAAAHLSGLADWLDLDAPLLIANDPFRGVVYAADGTLHLSDRPGIGVDRSADSPPT